MLAVCICLPLLGLAELRLVAPIPMGLCKLLLFFYFPPLLCPLLCDLPLISPISLAHDPFSIEYLPSLLLVLFISGAIF